MLVPGVQIVIWYFCTLENNPHRKSSYQCYQLLLFCLVAKSCLTRDCMDCSHAGSPVFHHRLEFAHPTISCSVAPFSSCPQSFRASGFFPISRVFASGVTRQRYYMIVDYIPHTVHFIQVGHLFIYRWSLRLLPYLGCCRLCCSEHRSAYIFSN